MENNYIKEYQYIKAKKRTEKIKGFYIHTIITVFIIVALIFINLKFSAEYHWFWYPITGVSLGLIVHFISVFGADKLGFGKDWEERKIKQFLEENR
ncbi:2TM domain-containing protein [Tenacibaculum sp. 190524A02b]|uniref:2TM domain-containing protein n=1 Tax=Tenacibaculum vairaonense TaxID=3137860 RepID=A0ABM9PNP2_9FLAO